MVAINVAMQFEHVQRGGDTATTELLGLCGLFSVSIPAAALAAAALAVAVTDNPSPFWGRQWRNSGFIEHLLRGDTLCKLLWRHAMHLCRRLPWRCAVHQICP